jgi:hypothetical protein
MAWAERAAWGQDVSFEVRTKDGRSEHRIGEPIALQPVFTSSSKRYIVDTSFRYPELQRQPDEFLVNPSEGSSDPLEDYRHALSRNQLLFDGGGLRVGRLGEKPVTLDLLLNRYVRFSKPGQYVLSVRGLARESSPQLLERAGSGSRTDIKAPEPDIARAGAAWQQRQLSRALEALEKRPGIEVNACEILRLNAQNR